MAEGRSMDVKDSGRSRLAYDMGNFEWMQVGVYQVVKTTPGISLSYKSDGEEIKREITPGMEIGDLEIDVLRAEGVTVNQLPL